MLSHPNKFFIRTWMIIGLYKQIKWGWFIYPPTKEKGCPTPYTFDSYVSPLFIRNKIIILYIYTYHNVNFPLVSIYPGTIISLPMFNERYMLTSLLFFIIFFLKFSSISNLDLFILFYCIMYYL